jgi:iron complex outermembrane recepter protein
MTPRMPPRSNARYALATALAALALPALAAEGPQPEVLPGIGVEGNAGSATPPPATAKTNTPIDELPMSIQVVPKALTDEQGVTGLKGAVVRNVSGLSEGGGSSYGFYDRFTSRGLDMNFMSDGLSDGPMTNGYNRSLTGVERVEVLKGPGSALFGSGSPGGTVNLVRAKPQEAAAHGLAERVASFGSTATTAYSTGKTGIDGVLYRVDGGYSRTDGFRDVGGETIEFLPTLEWRPTGTHTLTAAVEYRHIQQVADSYGIPFQGTGLAKVDPENKFYTPFADTEQDIAKLTLAHEWSASTLLTVNTRFTHADRQLELMRNAGGTVAGSSFTMTGRKLRKQDDHWQDTSMQVEPTWTFNAFGMGHTALTGVELQRHVIDADRHTATLGNIADIRNPVIPERNVGDVSFSTHDFDDTVKAIYTSAYANDQIDVTERLKLRGGLRYDHFDTEVEHHLWSGTGTRQDDTLSWQAGALYKLAPGISPFVGVSRSYLANLSSEALASAAGLPETNLGGPERGTQYEAGIKAESSDKRLSGTVSVFQVARENFVQISGTSVFQASQRTRGAEFDIAVEPIEGWRTNANFTLQDARLTDFPSTPGNVGLHPLGVPRTMANLWTSWAIPGLDGTKLAGGVSYKDNIFLDNTNTQKIPGYVVADLVATQEIGAFELAAGINNLFDRDTFQRNSNGGAFPGEPRTVFARASAKF